MDSAIVGQHFALKLVQVNHGDAVVLSPRHETREEIRLVNQPNFLRENELLHAHLKLLPAHLLETSQRLLHALSRIGALPACVRDVVRICIADHGG